MAQKSSFAPVVDRKTRIVILGSLPGEESLRQHQYYAHPQNRFWELVGSAIGVDLRSLAYADRLAALLAHRIGLWDVIGKAHRTGSLDSAIRNEERNDLVKFAESLPELRAIAFNGKKSATVGRKQLSGIGSQYELIDLPSSSPAYAAMPIAEKQRRWAAIAQFTARGS